MSQHPQGKMARSGDVKEFSWKGHQFANEEPVGQGSFGKVFKTYHVPSRKHFAVKKLHLPSLKPEEIRMTEQEIKLSMMCSSHENVIKCLGDYFWKEDYCLVMELCPGGVTLESYINGDDPSHGVYVPTRYPFLSLMYLKQLVDGVAYIHSKKIIHMDLKPENILLSEYLDKIKIVDFGCAVQMSGGLRGNLTIDNGGTAMYLPPELHVEPPKPYDSTADVFAIGCIAYVLFGGNHPFFRTDAEMQDTKNRFSPAALPRILNLIRRGYLEKAHYEIPGTVVELITGTAGQFRKNRPLARDLVHFSAFVSCPRYEHKAMDYLKKYNDSIGRSKN